MDLGLLIPFNIYWIKNSGVKTLLNRKGDFCNIRKVISYKNKGAQIEIDSQLSEAWLLGFIDQLNKLASLEAQVNTSPSDIQKWRKEFIKIVVETLWEDGEEVSRLDVCFAVGIFFCNLDEDTERLFLSLPIEIQRKNYLTAAFGVIFGILLGYTDINILKDYFSILLFLDYPFSSSMWSEQEKDYLIQSRKNTLNVSELNQVTKLKIEMKYLDLLEKYQNDLGTIIKNKSFLKYLEYSFERFDGSGFPKGLSQNNLSDIDCMTIFLYSCFSFEEDLDEPPQEMILKKIFYQNEENKDFYLNTRLETLFLSTIEKIQEYDDSFLKISGL